MKSQQEKLRLATQLAVSLPDNEIEDLNVLIAAGEYRIALENLCTQLFEYGQVLSLEYRDLLEALGEMCGVDVGALLD